MSPEEFMRSLFMSFLIFNNPCVHVSAVASHGFAFFLLLSYHSSGR